MKPQFVFVLLLILASPHTRSETATENIWQQRDGTALSAGLFLVNYSSKIRSSTDDTLGTLIKLEDDLGLEEDDEILRVEFVTRPWPKHRFFLSYMEMDRNGNQTLDKDITFNGVTFPAGLQAGSKLDVGMYRGGYTWSFLQNDEWELGLSAGVYYIDLDMHLESVDHQVRAQDSTGEPFPMFGLSGTWLVNKDWLIRGTAEAFKIDRGNTDGDFYNIRFAGEYSITEALSVGAGYDLVRIDAENTKNNDEIVYDYDGAVIFLRWQF
jgi:hypothetical protein